MNLLAPFAVAEPKVRPPPLAPQTPRPSLLELAQTNVRVQRHLCELVEKRDPLTDPEQ